MSLVKSLSKAEIESIYSAANSAVWHSHHGAGARARQAVREEDYVATLVTYGVGLLANRWIEILSPTGIALQISGVFCHGHPQVRFGPPQSQVELADLLIVHRHSTKLRTTTRAMLVQAKMSTDGTHRLPPGDAQLTLFSTWPAFEFVTGGLKSGLRDIKEVGKGSRYALILAEPAFPEDIRWADQCPWAASPARRNLAAERSLSKVLGDMLLGKDGRAVQLNAPRDDWSRTIKELLEITGKKVYRRTNINLGSTARLSETMSSVTGTLFLTQSPTFAPRRPELSPSQLFFGEAAETQLGNHREDPPGTKRRSDSDGGMSALIIETHVVDNEGHEIS